MVSQTDTRILRTSGCNEAKLDVVHMISLKNTSEKNHAHGICKQKISNKTSEKKQQHKVIPTPDWEWNWIYAYKAHNWLELEPPIFQQVLVAD